MAARLAALVTALLASTLWAAAPEGMVLIPSGVFQPFFKNARAVPVTAFYLDSVQVTNQDFLEFVQTHPTWKRSSVKPVFADRGYLAHWISDTSFSPDVARAPVTGVSFFAARAYCEWRGKKLPSLARWEYAAGADGRAENEEERTRLLAWYAHSAGDPPGRIGQKRDAHGVYDLQGLVWEWVSDFNSVVMSEESREDATDKQLFCGGGAASARDFRNYSAFMRYAHRSSLRANYTGTALGFRCAKDL